MFYIDRQSIDTKKEALIFHILPAVIVFITLMILTIVSVSLAKEATQKEQESAAIAKTATITENFAKRMTVYEDILRGGSGVFAASDEVTRQEWKAYIDAYDVENRYAGIQGVGYAELISKDNLQKHINSIKLEGFKDYMVYPTGERDVYSSIVYLEPFTGDNLKAFGYDMYSDATRRKAMDMARDTNMPAVSDLVKLVQEEDSNDPQSGFLMYVPLYEGPANTIEERRENISGYVYAPFKTRDLIDNIYDHKDEYFAFSVYKLSDNNEKQLVYASSNLNSVINSNSIEVVEQNLDLLGSKWEFYGYSQPAIVNSSNISRPDAILLTGTIISVLAGAIMYLLLKNRTTALHKQDERTIQEAKDELLALASHQLRTPATGVKQYIGMLKDGMAGNLTKLQKSLIDKAYESNERQLDTINDMLFVARADAGELNISVKHLNLTRLIKDIMRDMQPMIARNQQTLQQKIQENDLYIKADAQYIRMAVENIISNASKYTKPGGNICVTLLEKSNKTVSIEIKDNGVGIQKKDMQLLFKKFSRIPNELTSKVVGSGIGLYLVRKIIDAHNGNIKVTSSTDIGTTITVILPKE
jgi:signal transduction histidine kinase